MPDNRDSDTWLTITQAASRLGIHPTTLRRWADENDIAVMVTPGGHRRFASSVISRFAEEHQLVRKSPDLEKTWVERALTTTRMSLDGQRDQEWINTFDESDRERKRILGRRLFGLILQYVSMGEGGEDILNEAGEIGEEEASNAIKSGLPLTEALRAVLFFRDALIESALDLPGVLNIPPEANARLVHRLSDLLNVVELSIAAAYSEAEAG